MTFQKAFLQNFILDSCNQGFGPWSSSFFVPDQKILGDQSPAFNFYFLILTEIDFH